MSYLSGITDTRFEQLGRQLDQEVNVALMVLKDKQNRASKNLFDIIHSKWFGELSYLETISKLAKLLVHSLHLVLISGKTLELVQIASLALLEPRKCLIKEKKEFNRA